MPPRPSRKFEGRGPRICDLQKAAEFGARAWVAVDRPCRSVDVHGVGARKLPSSIKHPSRKRKRVHRSLASGRGGVVSRGLKAYAVAKQTFLASFRPPSTPLRAMRRHRPVNRDEDSEGEPAGEDPWPTAWLRQDRVRPVIRPAPIPDTHSRARPWRILADLPLGPLEEGVATVRFAAWVPQYYPISYLRGFPRVVNRRALQTVRDSLRVDSLREGAHPMTWSALRRRGESLEQYAGRVLD
jgi:hypothetical protein